MLRKTYRKLSIIGAAIFVFILVIAVIITWTHFYPRYTTDVVGPQGYSKRAFIENQSFGDITLVLFASDWPYTFISPVSLGEVRYSEGSNSHVFWSTDGSVLVVRDGVDMASWKYTYAYDYNNHEIIRYDTRRIASLLESRGGVGPELAQYPDGKNEE